MTCTNRWRPARLAIPLAGLAAAFCLSTPERAAAQVGPLVEDPWSEAQSIYAEGRYEEALPYVIETIQRDPRNPTWYRGLARILYGLERWDEAVFYYDIYLVDLVDDLPDGLAAGDRPDAVREERDYCNSQREDPSVPVRAPERQEQARAIFLEALDSGTIVTVDGGGAWGMFEGILRSGYARPDLVDLHERLSAALLDEAELFVSSRAARMPSLSYERWEAQRRRFDAWRTLTGWESDPGAEPPPGLSDEDLAAFDPAALRGNVRAVEITVAQIALCDGQLEFLDLNYERAADHFAVAVDADPDLVPAHMGRLNALIASGDAATPEAAAAFDALAAAVDRVAPASTDVVTLYAAALAADMGETYGAANHLATLLGLPAVEAPDDDGGF